jgi:hypothetical protein
MCSVVSIEIDKDLDARIARQEIVLGTRPWWRPSFGMLWEQFKLIAFITTSVKDMAAFFTTAAAFFGLTASQAESDFFHIPIENAPFPVRLVVFLAFSAGVGWMTGLLVRAARRWARDIRVIISIILAILTAGFVAGLADWLVAPRQRTDLPQEFLLVLIGAMFALRSMVENLSAQRGLSSPAAVSERSLVPLSFTLATAAILIFQEMGAR